MPTTLTMLKQPQGAFARQIQLLRTQLLAHQPGQVIQFTSLTPITTLTPLVANLAVACANIHQRVLLIDLKLKQPELQHYFSVNSIGIADYLAQQNNLKLTTFTPQPALTLLSAGHSALPTADLLGSPYFDQLLQQLRQHYDLILLLTPPLQPLADAQIVAPSSDGVVLTVPAHAKKRVLKAALDCLKVLQVPVIGSVYLES
jgi:Mrp family chromosome partitioning ATPase